MTIIHYQINLPNLVQFHLVQYFLQFLKKINFEVKGVVEHRDKRCQNVNISFITKMNLGGVGEHRESETNN